MLCQEILNLFRSYFSLSPPLRAVRSRGSTTSTALRAAANRTEGQQNWEWQDEVIDPSLTELSRVFLRDFHGVVYEAPVPPFWKEIMQVLVRLASSHGFSMGQR